jgi:hypothetical protein
MKSVVVRIIISIVTVLEDSMKKVLDKENSISPTAGIGSTFVVKVVYAENFSIQGYIKWIEEDRTVPFRSYMELLHLIEEGLYISREQMARLRSWDLDANKWGGDNDQINVL